MNAIEQNSEFFADEGIRTGGLIVELRTTSDDISMTRQLSLLRPSAAPISG